jgi:hypothetical protein
MKKAKRAKNLQKKENIIDNRFPEMITSLHSVTSHNSSIQSLWNPGLGLENTASQIPKPIRNVFENRRQTNQKSGRGPTGFFPGRICFWTDLSRKLPMRLPTGLPVWLLYRVPAAVRDNQYSHN